MGRQKTFEELTYDPGGTVYFDQTDSYDVRFVILRGGMSLCAYVGIPATHPLAGKDYEDFALDCHGGLTFAEAELEGVPDDGIARWWYGWDYAHGGDQFMYTAATEMFSSRHDHPWTVTDVFMDSRETINELHERMAAVDEEALVK